MFMKCYYYVTVLMLVLFSTRAICDDSSSEHSDFFRCKFKNKEEFSGEFKTAIEIERGFIDKCKNAISVELLSGKTVDLQKYKESNIDYLLTDIKGPLLMCLELKNTNLGIVTVYVPAIKGRCRGPQLKIVNNTELYELFFGKELMNHFRGSRKKQIVIHANKNLPDDVITNLSQYSFIELQEPGECMLPNPLMSLDIFKQESCKAFYGPMIINSEADPHHFRSKIKSYNWTGCLQIEDTKLKNVKFLRRVNRFRSIEGCHNRIQRNKNLCLTEMLNFLFVRFKEVAVSDNSKPCQYDCIGGLVTDDYLVRLGRCTRVHGDLKISGWNELPVYVDMLRKIKHIRGRLIIENCVELGEFDYFSRLETITPMTGNTTAIILKNNEDLSALPMPNLKDIKIDYDDPRVLIIGNPALFKSRGKEDIRTTTIPRGESTSIPKEEDIPPMETKDENFTMLDKSPNKLENEIPTRGDLKESAMGIVLGVVLTLIMLFIILGLVICLFVRTYRRKFSLPTIILTDDSKKTLASMSEDISSIDPISWSSYDTEVIWTPGREAAGADVDEKEKAETEVLKSFMAVLAANGRISPCENERNEKLLLHRIQELINYEHVVMIGSGGNVSEVVPRLPNKKHTQKYTDRTAGVTYKLRLIRKQNVSTRTKYYVYKVKCKNKQGNRLMHVVYYDWMNERLPTDFSELLQLVQFCNDKNAICVSDRKKEVFSILHFLFNCVVAAKKVKLFELFQFHNKNCNGAPLDRDEMLFVFRAMVGWAQASSCDMDNKKINEWCETYTQVANYVKDHPNVRNIVREMLASEVTKPQDNEEVLNENGDEIFNEQPAANASDGQANQQAENVETTASTMINEAAATEAHEGEPKPEDGIIDAPAEIAPVVIPS